MSFEAVHLPSFGILSSSSRHRPAQTGVQPPPTTMKVLWDTKLGSPLSPLACFAPFCSVFGRKSEISRRLSVVWSFRPPSGHAHHQMGVRRDAATMGVPCDTDLGSLVPPLNRFASYCCIFGRRKEIWGHFERFSAHSSPPLIDAANKCGVNTSVQP